jgi:hypothetical protein
MIPCTIVTTEEAVNEYLTEHQLMDGFAPLEAVLLQLEGTAGGLPCAMLVAEIGGRKVLIKTTLRMLLAATRALNGVAEDKLGKGWIGP